MEMVMCCPPLALTVPAVPRSPLLQGSLSAPVVGSEAGNVVVDPSSMGWLASLGQLMCPVLAMRAPRRRQQCGPAFRELMVPPSR